MSTGRPPLSYVPMASPLVGVVSGIVIVPLLPTALAVVVSVSMVIAGVCALVCRRRWIGRAMIFVAVGYVAVSVSAGCDSPAIPADDEVITLTGVVDEVSVTGSGRRFRIHTEGPFGCVALYMRGYGFDAAESDIVCARATLLPPEALRWPGQADMDSYRSRHGIDRTARVCGDSIEVTGHATGLIWSLRRLRVSMADGLRRSELSDPATRFMIAALLGDSSQLSPDDRSRFSAAGVAHLLALSGTHVAVISAMFAIMLFPLYLMRRRRLLMVVTVVLLWGYAVLTGLSPSVVRAVIMATVLAGSVIMERVHSSFNALLTAAVVILVADPSALYAVGFQLSFVAVAAILVVMPLTVGRLREAGLRGPLVAVLSAVIVTLAATMATAPVTVCCFGVFPVYFLLANLPAMLLIGPLLYGGAGIVLSEAMGIPSAWLCRVVDMLYGLMDGLLTMVAGLPGHLLTGVSVSPVVAMVWLSVVVAAMALLWRPRLPAVRLAVAVSVLVLVVAVVVDGRVSRDGTAVVGDEMFIANHGRYAGLIYRSGHRAWLITPEPPLLADELLSHARRVHRGYLAGAGVDSLVLASDTMAEGCVVRRGPIVSFDGDTIVFVTGDSARMPRRVSAALVCRGTTGAVRHRLAVSCVDTVVMMPGSHWRVGRTLGDALSDVPVVGHRATILHRVRP